MDVGVSPNAQTGQNAVTLRCWQLNSTPLTATTQWRPQEVYPHLKMSDHTAAYFTPNFYFDIPMDWKYIYDLRNSSFIKNLLILHNCISNCSKKKEYLAVCFQQRKQLIS